MEGKIVGYLLVLVFVIAAGAWVNTSIAIADLRSKIVDVRTSIKTIERSNEAAEYQISIQEGKLTELNARSKAESELIAQQADTTHQIAALNASTEQHEQRTVALAGNLSQLVMGMRAAAVGEKMETLPLPNGTTLRNAQIKRISEDTIVVAHSIGSARLHRNDAPPEWVERFQLVDLARPTSMPVKPPAGVAVATAPSVVIERAPAAPPMPTKVAELHTKIAQIQARIHIAHGNASVWQTRASELQSNFTAAEAKGRIVTNKDRVDSGRKSANTYTLEARQLEAQLIELQAQLMQMNTGG